MSDGQQTETTLNRNTILLVTMLFALWIGSIAATLWWGNADRARSAFIRDHHIVFLEASRQLTDQAAAIQRLLTDENPQLMQLAQGIEDHLSSADETISQISPSNRDLGDGHGPVTVELIHAMREFEAMLNDPAADLAVYQRHADLLSLRAEQLERLSSKLYDLSVSEVIADQSRGQWVLVVSLSILFIIAVTLSFVALRQIRRLNGTVTESSRQLGNATRIANLGYSRWNADGRCIESSPEYLEIFGLTDELLRQEYDHEMTFRQLVHPDDRDSFSRSIGEQRVAEATYRIRTPEGEIRHVSEVMETVADGSLMVVTSDVSDIKRAEERLVQAQKMEVVGQLTGGIAHDFNNILTVIMGGSELIDANRLDDSQKELFGMLRRAAERGATLTSQLLAYARRQPLNPTNTDLTRLIADLDGFFRRTLGEDIDIKIVQTTDCWPVYIDRHQMETALLNLLLNARDAMPDGGHLTIELANTSITKAYAATNAEMTPGDYAMVSISDTGEGMDPDELERVFEPFFTTKETGRGTGLGLSMVFGFVKQSAGHIAVYSEKGEGTTFRIYLPRSTENQPVETTVAEEDVLQPTGTTTILIVEDEPDVRKLVTAQVKSIGHEAHVAPDAEQALEILHNVQVDILLTDLVLPGGMNGKALADEALRRDSELKVLFMSGYTKNAVIHRGRLDPGVTLLQKPFTIDALRAAIASL